MSAQRLKSIFQEPPVELDGECRHGVLFVGMNMGYQQLEWIEAARAYKRTALHLVDRALKEGVAWDEAHPALFMCCHALELYLKALVPDWKQRKKKTADKSNGHDLSIFSKTLRELLKNKYKESDIQELCDFIDMFQSHDPKSMAFRFPDACIASLDNEPEIWVDFRNLRGSIELVFDALDHLYLNRNNNRCKWANYD